MVSLTTGRATSKQDYSTPVEFLSAVENVWGPIVFDLAASADNTKHPRYFDKEQDSLAQDWAALSHDVPPGVLWLNPPFRRITPWAKKCAETRPRLAPGRKIALLIPCAPGTQYFRRYIYGQAVWNIVGRVTFNGKDPFPRDCELDIFVEQKLSRLDLVPHFWDWRKYSTT